MDASLLEDALGYPALSHPARKTRRTWSSAKPAFRMLNIPLAGSSCWELEMSSWLTRSRKLYHVDR
ncbi:MAG: hypothetical protein K6U00_13295, partial [Armatimonadetes bacterium]|nr:hypothetical protein [Armatimonadota bacterium]